MSSRLLLQANNAGGRIVRFVKATPGNYAALGGVTAFSRADGATPIASYTDVNNVQQLAAQNILRDAHYIGTVRVILLESSRRSLVLHSDDFSNPSWIAAIGGAGAAPVVTANATAAPDGNNTAAKLVFSAPGSGDQSMIEQLFTGLTVSSSYTESFWIKAFAADDVGKTVIFRGVHGSGYTGVVLSSTWQRVGAAEVATLANEQLQIGLRPIVGGGSSGTVSCYLWRGQLELGAFASSGIPTGAAAVTRAVDALTLGGASITGTLFYHYFNLATQAWTDAVAAYASGTAIIPPVDRAYSHIAVLAGTLTAAQCKAALGGTFP